MGEASAFVLSEFHFTADEHEKTRPHTHTQRTLSLYGEKNCDPQKTRESLVSFFPLIDNSSLLLMCSLPRLFNFCCRHLRGNHVLQIGPIRSTISQDKQNRVVTVSEVSEVFLYLVSKLASEREWIALVFFHFHWSGIKLPCFSLGRRRGWAPLLHLSFTSDWDRTKMDGWMDGRWKFSVLSLRLLWACSVCVLKWTLNQRLLLQWGHSAWMF